MGQQKRRRKGLLKKKKSPRKPEIKFYTEDC